MGRYVQVRLNLTCLGASSTEAMEAGISVGPHCPVHIQSHWWVWTAKSKAHIAYGDTAIGIK